MLFQHIILNLSVSRFRLRTCCIHLIQVQLNSNSIIRFLLGQQNNRLHMARLLRIDVWMLQIRSVCMREFIQGQNQQQCGQNIALSVLGKMSTRRLLLNYMQSERFSDRLKTELRGNKSGLPSPQPLFMNFPVAIAFAADTLDPTTLNQNFNRTFHCAA